MPPFAAQALLFDVFGTVVDWRGGIMAAARLRPAGPAAPREPGRDPASVQHRARRGPEAELAALNLAWHRLDPGPDAVAGLTRLRRGHIIGPLPNANVAPMLAIAKRAAP